VTINKRTILGRGALLALLVSLVSVTASAQTPVLTPAVLTVAPNTSVQSGLTGAPGQFYAVLGSRSGSGVSYGGVDLAVGPDVILLAQGVLDASGHASVHITPPFQGASPERYFVQAVTSPSATFVPLSAGASVVFYNATVAGALPVSASINPNGTIQFATAGVTAQRLGVGRYRINYGNLVATPFLPTVTVASGRLLGINYTPSYVEVTLDVDTFFIISMLQVRP